MNLNESLGLEIEKRSERERVQVPVAQKRHQEHRQSAKEIAHSTPASRTQELQHHQENHPPGFEIVFCLFVSVKQDHPLLGQRSV